ncbi:hypothetical protein [Agreia pratensis]|nr:hypothetical protein [Agreia pratensis]
MSNDPNLPNPDAPAAPAVPPVPPAPSAPPAPAVPPASSAPSGAPSAAGAEVPPMPPVGGAPVGTPPVGGPPVGGPPVGGPPVAPGKPSALAQAVRPEQLIGLLLPLGAGLVGTYMLGLVFSILTVMSAGEPRPWSIVAALPLQLMGAGLLGTISATVSAGMFGVSISGSVIAFTVPVLFLLLQAGAVATLSYRAELRIPTTSAAVRWLVSLAQGIAYSLLLVILTLAGTASYTASGTTFSATTSSVSLFFGAVVIITLSAALARSRAARSRGDAKPLGLSRTMPAALSSALRVAFGYTVVASVIAAIAIAIGVAVQESPDALLSAPLWLPSAALAGLAIMHLGQISLGGSMQSSLGSEAPSSVWIGSAEPWVVIVDIVLVLVLIALAGVWLRLARSTSRFSPLAAWGSTVGAFALAGLLVSLFGSVIATGSVGGLVSGSVSVGPAPWTLLLFAAVGALVELVARYAGGILLGLLPAAFVARLSRLAAPSASPAVAGGDPQPAAPVLQPAHPEASAEATGGTVPVMAPTTAASATTPPPAAPAAPAATPLDPRTKKRILVGSIVGGGALVLVLLATVGLSIANGAINPPQARVTEYLDALVDGKASEALALADVDAPKADRVLLDDKVFAAATERITSYEITSVNTSNDVASVTAELDQDGRKSTVRFSVRSTGKQWLFFDNWKLERPDQGSIRIYAPESIEKIQVNGIDVDLTPEQRDGSVDLPVLPGTYEVGVADSDKWLTAKPVSKTVVAGESSAVLGLNAPAVLEPEPSDELTSTITTQVDDYLAKCIASTTVDPENCPNSVYAYGSPTNVVWTLDKKPAYEIRISSDGELQVNTAESGSASVTYKYTSVSQQRDGSDKTSIRISGTIELDGDKATFTPDDSYY